MPDSAYGDYISSQQYEDYYTRYFARMRESDRVMIDLIRECLPDTESPRLFDMGCATGALLYHLKRALPRLELYGGDVYPDVVAKCRSNPALAGIAFEVADALSFAPEQRFDVVTANAVLSLFDDGDFARALASIAGALKPGGLLVAFDPLSPYGHDLEIRETSATHPAGMTWFFRAYETARYALRANGFAHVDIQPFDIPIDLPRSDDPADITTHTVRDEDGSRLLFRGALYQPWCHIVARLA